MLFTCVFRGTRKKKRLTKWRNATLKTSFEFRKNFIVCYFVIQLVFQTKFPLCSDTKRKQKLHIDIVVTETFSPSRTTSYVYRRDHLPFSSECITRQVWKVQHLSIDRRDTKIHAPVSVQTRSFKEQPAETHAYAFTSSSLTLRWWRPRSSGLRSEGSDCRRTWSGTGRSSRRPRRRCCCRAAREPRVRRRR